MSQARLTRLCGLGALALSLNLTACSGDDGPVDAGPEFELPQILPGRTPLCLSYTPTTVNDPKPFSLSVDNQGRQQLIISGARIEGDERGFFQIQGPDVMVVETYESALFQITYSPTEPGWDEAVVVIESNAQNYPALRVSMLARAVPEAGTLDGGVSNWDAGPKPPEAVGSDGGETCPDDESRM